MKIFFIILSITTSIICVWTDVNYTLMDMSKICIEDLHRSVFLPYTMGIADAVVIVITNRYNLRNCTIVFHQDVFDENIMKIIVIESLNKLEKNACAVTNVYLIDNGTTVANLCHLFDSDKFDVPFIYNTYNDFELTIKDIDSWSFHATKVTATASRQLKNEETCNSTNEISCGGHANYSCISRELQCDQNINCGYYNLYDESDYMCKEMKNKNLWAILIVGSFMAIFVLYIFVHLTLKCFPICKNHFSRRNRNEENTMVLTTQYLPAIKTYIPMKKVETLHIHPSGIESTSKSSLTGEEIKPDPKLFNNGGYNSGKGDLYHKRKDLKK